MRRGSMCVSLLVLAASASADASEPVVPAAGVGSEVLVVGPLSEWGDLVGPALGVTGWLRHAVSPHLTFTARIGALAHRDHVADTGPAGDLVIELLEVPALGGFRLSLEGHGGSDAFVFAEAGAVWWRSAMTYGDEVVRERRYHLASSAGVGVIVGPVEVRGGLYAAPVDTDHLSAIASVGVAISQF